LKLGDGVAFDAKHRVTPTRALAASIQPVIADARAADESDPAVHDYQLAMRAIVDSRQRMQADRVIPFDAPTRRRKRFEIFVPCCKAADRVDHKINLDSGSRPVGKRFDESMSYSTLLKDISFDIDVVLGVANRFEFGFVKDLAVGEHFDTRVSVNSRIRERTKDSQEVFGFKRGGRWRRDPIAQPGLEQCEEQHQQQECDRYS